MASVAAKTPPRRRGGRRILIAVGILILLIAGGVVWLNLAAQAQVNVPASLTVYQQTASVAHNDVDFNAATTGSIVQPGDSVKTDAKGRAGIQLPDGTLTRLASETELTLKSAHFSKDGNLHDATLTQKLGRTFTNVQHLISGASFSVRGQSAEENMRGTKFEVLITPDGKMIVKLFEGELDFDGKNHVHLTTPQQATADAQGNVGPAGPILPDRDDPFGAQIQAQDASSQGTTPGTEQLFMGAPLHDGEQQQYTYSFAGEGIVKAALGYPG